MQIRELVVTKHQMTSTKTHSVFVLIFQGSLTLLAGVLGSALPDAAVTEMSAVGGVILMGMALNMLDCTNKRIRVANMLPAVFLPILWVAFIASS